jgi:hypothetical protein
MLDRSIPFRSLAEKITLYEIIRGKKGIQSFRKRRSHMLFGDMNVSCKFDAIWALANAPFCPR